MSIHRADLFASRDDDSVRSWGSIELYVEGECDLADGLAIEIDAITGLRRQALALAKNGKYTRAIDVVLGVSALGSVHPADALILELCDLELGRMDVALRDRAVACRLLRALDRDGEAEQLIEEVPPIALFDAREEWEDARRLASSVESLRAFCRGRQTGSDPEAVSSALKAAGMCEAVAKFPAGQLSLLRKRMKEEQKPVRRPLLRLQDPFDAVSELGRILADPELAESLGGKPHLDALAVLFDQASSAPDYSMTRTGEFHPPSREAYRRREHGAMSLYLSEGRHEHSHAEATRIARAIAAGGDVEALLVGDYVREIGAHEAFSSEWRPALAAVLRAIETEALFPLRAIAETVQDMADEDPERGHSFYREAVNRALKRVLEGEIVDLELLWSFPFDREPHRLVRHLAR